MTPQQAVNQLQPLANDTIGWLCIAGIGVAGVALVVELVRRRHKSAS